jgi:enoyl-CoA hydratase/carnithine racemase
MEVLGPATTREMLLQGDPLPATGLHALGLIARCAPADQPESEAARVSIGSPPMRHYRSRQ